MSTTSPSNSRDLLKAVPTQSTPSRAPVIPRPPASLSEQRTCLIGSTPGADAIQDRPDAERVPTRTGQRVALVSFLFNWPSTGGGIIHTVELGQFLARAGYQVQHLYPVYEPWDIGRVNQTLPTPNRAIRFEPASWSLPSIMERFRRAVDDFAPDWVIVTDSWNTKPILAEAVQRYPYILRFQAEECLCPLNNVRLLINQDGSPRQCPNHQLADPEQCRRCVHVRSACSGPLHRVERDLCQVGHPSYQRRLERSLREAKAVLVLNPLLEAMVAPYAPAVQVVPWGMDPERFPWPVPPRPDDPDRPVVIFQAGAIGEYMKGYHVLQAACERLREHRQDFRLVATGHPAGSVNEWTSWTGWTSQDALPALYHDADIVVVPTVAQEGLSRTSVEAMAAGKPVVASRIGGLPMTVQHEVTGLLAAPGDPDDLARQLGRLLDDAAWRHQLGRTGRSQFESEWTWEKVIERYYRPLLT